MGAERLEILRELVPAANKLLGTNQDVETVVPNLQAATAALGLHFVVGYASSERLRVSHSTAIFTTMLKHFL
jgi:hypothetical protein